MKYKNKKNEFWNHLCTRIHIHRRDKYIEYNGEYRDLCEDNSAICIFFRKNNTIKIHKQIICKGKTEKGYHGKYDWRGST